MRLYPLVSQGVSIFVPMSAEDDFKRTQGRPERVDPDRTQFMGSPPPSPPAVPGVPGAGAASFDPKRTRVVGEGVAGAGPIDPTRTQVYQGPGVSPVQRQAPQNRKLVGWLVSFTIHPNGVDFRLYEGKNTIGSNPTCDVVLNDPGVSGHHMTILYRGGKYRFKDEFSTNGTFVNGEMQEEGELKDGDILKLGETELRFRTV